MYQIKSFTKIKIDNNFYHQKTQFDLKLENFRKPPNMPKMWPSQRRELPNILPNPERDHVQNHVQVHRIQGHLRLQLVNVLLGPEPKSAQRDQKCHF